MRIKIQVVVSENVRVITIPVVTNDVVGQVAAENVLLFSDWPETTYRKIQLLVNRKIPGNGNLVQSEYTNKNFVLLIPHEAILYKIATAQLILCAIFHSYLLKSHI